MFKLPAANHPARELMGDLHRVAETLALENVTKLPAIWQARRQALQFFDAFKSASTKKPIWRRIAPSFALRR